MEENYNVNSLFLGAKAENAPVFEQMILEAFRDHVFWRKNFHPEDPLIFGQKDKRSFENCYLMDNMQSKFNELLSKLKQSVPFYSPRYIGHMAADILMPGILGYFSTMLYNPNNVSYESSPVTSELEMEVGRDLARMLGFEKDKSWAHLTSGGTVANIEALWVIRNLKFFPLIAVDLLKKYNKKLNIKLPNGEIVDATELNSEFDLLTLSPQGLSEFTNDFFAQDWPHDINIDVHEHSNNISHSGMGNILNAKVLVPASKHYSWPKAAEILGIGRKNLVKVNVDSNFRMDVADLKQKLKELHEEKSPVLAVIGVVGSTECGSIDPIDQIVEARKWYEKEFNASFYIHLDAAYGGYARAVFLDENYKFMPYEKLQSKYKIAPSKEVYESYKATFEVDSVTVDPHKLGYVPFGVGAVVYKDKSVKTSTMCKAPYINNTTKAECDDAYIGSYILEGSKPGSAAASCWLTHQVLPLNENGYGNLISIPIENVHYLDKMLKDKSYLEVQTSKGSVIVDVLALNNPDLDILLYVFNIRGNKSLEKMNKLNELILEAFSFNTHKVIQAHDYIISSTDFAYDIYGNSMNASFEKLGIDIKDWQTEVQLVKILRTSVVSSFLNKPELQDYYWQGFSKAIDVAIQKIMEEEVL